MDSTSILVGNLTEALLQLNQLLALAWVATISALALSGRPTSQTSETDVPLFGVPMRRDIAQVLLIGVAFVAGLLALYASDVISRITGRLQSPNDSALLRAACTYASVATAPIGIPVIAAGVPAILGGITFVREIRRSKGDARKGLIMALVSFCGPYIAVAWRLGTSSCRA
jgi:hypothetical protein